MLLVGLLLTTLRSADPLGFPAATTLTFARHAETMANASGHYNSRTLNSFSDLGKREVAALVTKLPARFDRILVSPSPRALYTIAPYLRSTNQRALLWPLLYECCTGRRPHGAHPTPFKFGELIQIPADLKGLFILLKGEDRLPVAPTYDEGLAQVDQAVREFRARFAGGAVLIVGHSGEGGHMIHELTGRWIKLDNAEPIRLTLSSGDRGPTRR